MYICRVCLGEFALKESMYFVAPNGHPCGQPCCRECHEQEVNREVREKVILRPLSSNQVQMDQCLHAMIRQAHDLEFAVERALVRVKKQKGK
jgi:hypothetical protein